MYALMPRWDKPSFFSTVKDCTMWTQHNGRPVIVYWNGAETKDIISLQTRGSLFKNIAAMVLHPGSYKFALVHSFRVPQRSCELLTELSTSVNLLWQNSFQLRSTQTAYQQLTQNIATAYANFTEMQTLSAACNLLLDVEVRRVFEDRGPRPSMQELYQIHQDGVRVLNLMRVQLPSNNFSAGAGWREHFDKVKEEALVITQGVLREWGRRLSRPILACWMVEEAPKAGLLPPQNWQVLELPELIDTFIAENRPRLHSCVAFNRTRAAKVKQLGSICRTLLEKRLGDSDALSRLACFSALTVKIERAELAVFELARSFAAAPIQGPGAFHQALLQLAPNWVREDETLWQFYQERAKIWSQHERTQETAAACTWDLKNFFKRLVPNYDEQLAHIKSQCQQNDRNERLLLQQLDDLGQQLLSANDFLRALQFAAPLDHAGSFLLDERLELQAELKGKLKAALHERDQLLLNSLKAIHGDISTECADITLTCGADSYPLHRVVLLRLGENTPGIFCGLKYKRQAKELELPAEYSNDIGLASLLYYLYHGNLPGSTLELHADQILPVFRMAFALPEDADIDQVPPIKSSDWFSQHLEEHCDIQLPCLDGELPFFRALLTKFPKLLEAELLPLTVEECRCLLHVLLGAWASADWGPQPWQRFRLLQQHAETILGSVGWAEIRREALLCCLADSSADELLEAVQLAQQHPAERLVTVCSEELIQRLCKPELALEPYLSARRAEIIRFSCAQLNWPKDGQWDRIAQFLSGCSNLRQLNLAGSNVSSHHVLTILKACPKIQHIDLTGCINIHPAVRALAAGIEEELPTFLDPLTVHLLGRQERSKEQLEQAAVLLQQGPQPLLDAQAFEELVRVTDARVESLNLQHNPHVDRQFLRVISERAADLQHLQLPENQMNSVHQLHELSRLERLRSLHGAGDQVPEALRATSHPDLNQEN